MKTCKKCKNVKSLEDFPSSKTGRLGRRTTCIVCYLENSRAKYQLGYTAQDLEKRLRRTIPKGYTWKDFLDGKLHIDYKIPVAVFNFNCPPDLDFKKCFALTNLQLLPAIYNIKKGKKLDKPFQPSLAFGRS